MRVSKMGKALLAVALVGALAMSAVLAGCGCSRDKEGDVKKKQADTATVVGTWQLKEAMDRNDNKMVLDQETIEKSTIIIKKDMSATMSFVDGTYLGKVTRTPDADMSYQDAWGQYKVEAYTFSNADGSVEVEFCFLVRIDGSQQPFIVLRIDDGVAYDTYYYDRVADTKK